MYGTLFLIVIKGTINVGGLSVVIERNLKSGRFEEPEYVTPKKNEEISFHFFLLNLAFVWIPQ